MSNVFTNLRFSRCREVMSSRDAALRHLGAKEFTRGEPVIVNYYEDSSVNSSINTIVAVGIRNGIGKDCFRVVTLGQYEIVWGVVKELPDVSALVHNELYLYQDPRGMWYYVSAPDGITRAIEPILPIPHMYLNVENNLIYTSDESRQVRAITDVYTREEIDEILDTISGGDWSGLAGLEQKINEAYDAIQEVIRQNAEIVDAIDGIQDSVDVVNNFSSRVTEIEKKVGSLNVNIDGTISANFSSINLLDGEGGDSMLVDKTTEIVRENIMEAIDPDTAIPISTLNEILV